MAAFDIAVDAVLEHEGGYVDHPEDPGGATNMGITFKTLERWRGGRPITKEDVKALLRNEAVEIYRSYYWNVCRCDDMPAPVGFIVFDCAVNQGPGRAAQLIQRAVKVSADGIIGPKTMAEINAADPAELVSEFCARRASHYATLNPTFHLGWYRRLFDMHARALALATDQVTA